MSDFESGAFNRALPPLRVLRGRATHGDNAHSEDPVRGRCAASTISSLAANVDWTQWLVEHSTTRLTRRLWPAVQGHIEPARSKPGNEDRLHRDAALPQANDRERDQWPASGFRNFSARSPRSPASFVHCGTGSRVSPSDALVPPHPRPARQRARPERTPAIPESASHAAPPRRASCAAEA